MKKKSFGIDIQCDCICKLDIPKKISHVFRYLTWSQIPVKTSIWHTLRKKTKSLEPLAYERIAIVFQPMARASPASTKTNWRPDDQLGALEWWLWPQCVPGGCPLWKITYGQISGLMYFALWLSSSSKNLIEQSTFWYPLNVHCTLLFLGKKHIFIQGLASWFLKELKSQVFWEKNWIVKYFRFFKESKSQV